MSDANGPRRYQPRELVAMFIDPAWADDADADYLVVDLSPQEPGAVDVQGLSRRLAACPVPLIGIGAEQTDPLADAMDVLVESEPDLTTVLDALGANPGAAAVLVQVLRSVGKLPVLEALALESLGYATLQCGEEFAGWLAARARRPSVGPASTTSSHYEPVLLERQDSRLEIVLNAPHNRNALSTAMRDGLTGAFKLVAMDPGITAVDVRGSGPCFSAGGDLTEFGTTADAALAHHIRMRRMPARYLAPEAGRYHFHVHGACIGAGIELAAFAGHLTATEETYFQLPEVSMGLIPGAGGCVSIPRRIGRRRTAFMALSGQRIDARQALAWGLVDDVAE